MPKSRGIQRSYALTREGIASKFGTIAQRNKRIRALKKTMEKDERMHAGRIRAHETRMRNYALEKTMLMLLLEEDTRASSGERRA